MTPRKPSPRFTIERIDAAWQVLLRDGDTLHSLPVVPDPDPDLVPGLGPGGLVWATMASGSVVGLEARWRDGRYKILRYTTSQYALFHERTAGDWTALALGRPEGLKARAAELAAPTEAPEDLASAVPRDTCLASDVPVISSNPLTPASPASQSPARPKQEPTMSVEAIRYLRRMRRWNQ